jgi:hypothetical protein
VVKMAVKVVCQMSFTWTLMPPKIIVGVGLEMYTRPVTMGFSDCEE